MDPHTLKRKIVEELLCKEAKAPRQSLDLGTSAQRCTCNHMQSSLSDKCWNYLKSGLPRRVMYCKENEWINFPEQVTRVLVDAFSYKRSSAVVLMDNENILVDFLSMTMVRLANRKQHSIAWIDDKERCFFPTMHYDEEATGSVKLGSITSKSSHGNNVLRLCERSSGEVIKEVVTENEAMVSPASPLLCKKVTSIDRGSERFLFVQGLFLSGMVPFTEGRHIVAIHRYSPNDINGHCRLQGFEKLMKTVKEERGDADVEYAWLGCSNQEMASILIHGFGAAWKPTAGDFRAGVYLAPANRAFASVNLCDVDEQGTQYMLLCRVILGNLKPRDPPSGEDIRSGSIADDFSPKCYHVPLSHVSTNILPEYIVTFKLPAGVRGYLLSLKDYLVNGSDRQAEQTMSAPPTVKPLSTEGPTSPWVSFTELFKEIGESLTDVGKELLPYHYKELQKRKISREEFVMKMRIIVGDKVLKAVVTKLQHSPSLWYKLNTQLDQTASLAKGSSDVTGNLGASSPSTNLDDSRSTGTTMENNPPIVIGNPGASSLCRNVDNSTPTCMALAKDPLNITGNLGTSSPRTNVDYSRAGIGAASNGNPESIDDENDIPGVRRESDAKNDDTAVEETSDNENGAPRVEGTSVSTLQPTATSPVVSAPAEKGL